MPFFLTLIFARKLFPLLVSGPAAIVFFVFLSGTVLAEHATSLSLVPYPKQVTPETGNFSLNDGVLEIRLPEREQDLLGTALVQEMKRSGFTPPKIVASAQTNFVLSLAKPGAKFVAPELPTNAGEGESDPGESYALSVTPEGIICQGKSEAGLFYAVQTLCQLIRANLDGENRLSCMTIQDWPSMKYRCFQEFQRSPCQ